MAAKEGSLAFLRWYYDGVDEYEILEMVTSESWPVSTSVARPILSVAARAGAWDVVAMLAKNCCDYNDQENVLSARVEGPRPGRRQCPSLARWVHRSSNKEEPSSAPSGDGDAPPAPLPPISAKTARPKPESVLDLACRRGPRALGMLLVASFEGWAPHRLPLHCAARLGNTQALRKLLEAGEDPNEADVEHEQAVAKAQQEITAAADAVTACTAAKVAAQQALADATRDVASRQEERAAAGFAAGAAEAEAAVAEALASERKCRARATVAVSDLKDADALTRRKRSAHARLVGVQASPLHLVALAGCEILQDWENFFCGEEHEDLLPSEKQEAAAVSNARLLLDAGAAVDAIDASGRTPLHWAARSGNTLLVRLRRRALQHIMLSQLLSRFPNLIRPVLNLEQCVASKPGQRCRQRVIDADRSLGGRRWSVCCPPARRPLPRTSSGGRHCTRLCSRGAWLPARLYLRQARGVSVFFSAVKGLPTSVSVMLLLHPS